MCKVPLALLRKGENKEYYDLRSVEERSLIVGHDKQRAQVRLLCEYLSAEDLADNYTPIDILFRALRCDHEPTVRCVRVCVCVCVCV
jgi:hypothetical protein